MADLGGVPDVIGRATELEAIDRFLELARTGPASLVLEGDAGIGKTALWRAAAERARAAGARVLRAAPAASEQDLSLGGLTDLLAEVAAADLDPLPPVQRHALEIATLRSEPSGHLPDQRAISVATATLMRHLASAGPVLLAVDDVQWLDGTSVSILAYAVRRLAGAPVGVLLAARGSLAAPADELVSGVPAEQRQRLAIGPLPLAALHRLFLARLGRSFPRLVLLRVEETSGGNPLYALEIGRMLAESGAQFGPQDRLPIPASLGALIENRIAALPEAARTALLLAALSAEPTLATLDRAQPSGRPAFEAAIGSGIIRVDGGSVRFTHPLLAEAALSVASVDEVRAAHLALARAAGTDEARARHLGEAAQGPSERVAAALDAAAAAARARGATLDAASLYRRASRLTPAAMPDQALRRAIRAAECLFIDISEVVQADTILEAAIEAGPAGPVRAEALSLRAIIRYYHGQAPDAVRLGEQALAEVGTDAVLRATVLGRLAFLVMQLDLARGNALAAEALRLLGGTAGVDPDLQANVLLLHASSELGLVRGYPGQEIERGTALMTEDGRSWEHEGADGIAFGVARITDDLDRAISMTERLIRAKSGPGGDDPFNLVQLSGLQVLSGAWDAARVNAEAAREAYAREGASLYPAWGLRGVALVAAHDGRLEEACRLAAEGLRFAAESGDLVLQVYHHHILGFVALSLGDAREADAQLTRAADLARSTGTLHPGRFKLDGDRIEAALGIGQVERAAQIVVALDDAVRRAPTPWVRAIGLRARGLLQAAEGDLAGATVTMEHALVEHERLAMPFELGRTLQAKGRLHRRQKQKRLADESLRAAISQFERLGAPVWADAARAELARVGRRPRAADELTETERRVAELAATGLSSRQIAEVAFLAPKTVGNVLGRVYQKLGIHSRAELGARMAEDIGDDRSG